MADRPFTIQQTRPGHGPGGGDEIVIMGTGVDHGNGKAIVVPAEGLPRQKNVEDPAVVVDLADLTSGQGHHGFRTELVYDQE